jgi:phenylalanyl-tRNA synthetase beta chain
MVFSYNWLQSFFKNKLPEPKKLAELLTLHIFEVEDVKKAGNDWIFDIDITPNRPDCLSYLGIARECSAITGKPLRMSKIEIKKIEESKEKIQDFAKIETQSKDCKRYLGRMLFEVKVGVSPKYIQERLESCGLEPINNIVDAANYVMLETGQPIHVFDFDKISSVQNQKHAPYKTEGSVKGSKIHRPTAEAISGLSKNQKSIIIRRSRKGEEIKALNGKTYQLGENILVIADEEKPLAIAGIKGGQAAAIDQNTKNIFLESANFESISIRKASQKLKLKTDASFRFEHGINTELAEFAIDRLVSLIKETAGGKVLKGKIDFYPQKAVIRKIVLDIDYLNQLLGTDISISQAISILSALQIKAKQKAGQKIEAEIPSDREDIILPEDLIEEIGRIYGYQNIVSRFPVAALVPAERNQEIAWENKIKDLLKEEKFIETYNYSFIPQKEGDYLDWKQVGLENPFSKEFYYLRPSLLLNILASIEKNLRHIKSTGKIKIFETGKIFRKRGKEATEKKCLAGAIYGEKKQEGFLFLKGLVDFLLHSLGISDIYYDQFSATSEESPQALWNNFRSAEIKINGKEVGFLGEISEEFLNKIGIKGSVFCFEFDLDLLIQFCNEEREYRPVSKYPSAVRDIAVLVPIETKIDEVMEIIYYSGGELVQDVDLFDIYQGEQLPQGKKNLAFHIVFQSQKKTLRPEEVNELQKKTIVALEKNPGWEVRR